MTSFLRRFYLSCIHCTLIAALALGLSGCQRDTAVLTADDYQQSLQLSLMYIEIGDFLHADSLLSELGKRKQTALWQNASALLAHARNDDLLAEKHYQNALKMDGKNITILNNYATFLLDRQQSEAALDVLRAAAAIKPSANNGLLEYNTAQAYLQLGHRQQGLLYLEKSIKKNPNLAYAHLSLAEFLYEQDNSESLLWYDRYFSLTPVESISKKALERATEKARSLRDIERLVYYQQLRR